MKLEKKIEERITKIPMICFIIYFFIFLFVMILGYIALILILVTPRGRERISQGEVNEAFIVGLIIILGICIIVLIRVVYKLVSLIYSKTPLILPPHTYNIPSTIKDKVWERDNGSCVKCKSKENIKYDKIVPWKLFGSRTLYNIQLLCEACFNEKYSELGEQAGKEEFLKWHKKNILKYTIDYEKIEEFKKEEIILWQVQKNEIIRGKIVRELNYFITSWRIIKSPKDYDIMLFLNGLFSLDDKKRITSRYIHTIGRIEFKKLDDKWRIKFFRGGTRSTSKIIGFKGDTFKNLNQKEKEEAITHFISLGNFSILKENDQISILISDRLY